MTTTTKTLLAALTHTFHPTISAHVLRASGEPDPVASLTSDGLRSLVRDLTQIGLESQAAHFLAQRVIRSLKLALDDPEVALEDKAATLLAAERATLAAVSGMVAIWAAESAETSTDTSPQTND